MCKRHSKRGREREREPACYTSARAGENEKMCVCMSVCSYVCGLVAGQDKVRGREKEKELC